MLKLDVGICPGFSHTFSKMRKNKNNFVFVLPIQSEDTLLHQEVKVVWRQKYLFEAWQRWRKPGKATTRNFTMRVGERLTDTVVGPTQ